MNHFLDAEGRYEIGQEVVPVDPLKFKDSRPYAERLRDATEGTGETDSLVVVQGTIKTLPLVVAGRAPWRTDIEARGVTPLAPAFDTVGWFAATAAVLERVGAVLLPPAIALALLGVSPPLARFRPAARIS